MTVMQQGYVNNVIKLEGTIKRFFYKNDDFKIGYLKTEESLITFKGSLYGVEAEEKLIIYGKWVSHPKYGDQLDVESWERPVPSTKEHTIEFLSSGFVKGVGKAKAKRIVAKLGNNAITIIKDKGESALHGIKGIGKSTAIDIYESIINTFEVQEIVKKLARFGISANVCMKLYKKYGEETLSKIMQNPYLLIEVGSISFIKADEIAKEIGISPTSNARMVAGICYVLNHLTNQGGHSYIKQDLLINESLKILNMNTTDIHENIISYNELEQTLFSMEEKEVMFEGLKVYSKSMYTYETYIARKISILLNNRGGEALPKIDRMLKQYQSKNGIILAEKQREAVYSLLQENVLVLTGKPGTGKTTTLRAMIEVYKSIYPKHEIRLSAPTGRASRKMSEATGECAVTVHSLLGYRQGEIPEHNEDNPLEADLVILDEWSMADLNLTYWLMTALERGTKVVFIGDIDQLPSVSPGNVLSDFIKAELPTIRLDQIFRQAEESQIVQNAHRINEGKNLLIDESKDDFYFIQENNNFKIAHLIVKSALRFIDLGYTLEEIMILSPMRSGEIGIDSLNEMLREAINPHDPLKNEIKTGNRFFREGDKVMQNVNDPDKNVFNGELGIVKHIHVVDDKDIIVCEFNGELIDYKKEDLVQLELGYALTIHKSQGGEAPIVIMPISLSHRIMLARNLYYTGVTRAKEKVVLIGQYEAMNLAINNDKITKRNSLLDQRIMKDSYELESYLSQKKNRVKNINQ